MKNTIPINKCVHDSDFLNEDAGGNAFMLGGESAIKDSSLPSCDIGNSIPDFNVNTGSGGAPIDTCSFYLNRSSFPNGFDNAPYCDQTCACDGFCWSGVVKTFGNVAPGIIKALTQNKNTGGRTKVVSGQGGNNNNGNNNQNNCNQQKKMTDTQKYLLWGGIGLGSLMIIGITIVAVSRK